MPGRQGKQKIVLDPEDFMALHLSALSSNGVGRHSWTEPPTSQAAIDDFTNALPCCIHGHACWLDGPEALQTLQSEMSERLDKAGLTIRRNDSLPRFQQLVNAGIRNPHIPFEEYVELQKVDVA